MIFSASGLYTGPPKRPAPEEIACQTDHATQSDNKPGAHSGMAVQQDDGENRGRAGNIGTPRRMAMCHGGCSGVLPHFLHRRSLARNMSNATRGAPALRDLDGRARCEQ